MLTAQEKRQQSVELNVNFKALGFSREQIIQDIKISGAEFDAAMAMTSEDPTIVWMVRDYMDEKLREECKEPLPYSKKGTNRWFFYKKTW